MRFEVAFGCSVILSVFLHALLAAGVVLTGVLAQPLISAFASVASAVL